MERQMDVAERKSLQEDDVDGGSAGRPVQVTTLADILRAGVMQDDHRDDLDSSDGQGDVVEARREHQTVEGAVADEGFPVGEDGDGQRTREEQAGGRDGEGEKRKVEDGVSSSRVKDESADRLSKGDESVPGDEVSLFRRGEFELGSEQLQLTIRVIRVIIMTITVTNF